MGRPSSTRIPTTGGNLLLWMLGGSCTHFLLTWAIYGAAISLARPHRSMSNGTTIAEESSPFGRLLVYSLDSNVSLTAERAGVRLSKSRIELIERDISATVRSNSSFLRFDEGGEEASGVEVNASEGVSFEVQLTSLLQMRSVAQQLELRYTNSGQSDDVDSKSVHMASSSTFASPNPQHELTYAYFRFMASLSSEGSQMAAGVKLSVVDLLTDTEIHVQGGRLAGVIVESWSKNITRKMSLTSSLIDDERGNASRGMPGDASTTTRQLAIAAQSQHYGMQIRVEQGKVSLSHGQTKIWVASDHHAVTLWSSGKRIELHTLTSSLGITVDVDKGLSINSYEEKAVLHIPVNSTSVHITVGQPLRLITKRTMNGRIRAAADKSNEHLLYNGSTPAGALSNSTDLTNFERVEVIAATLQMLINTYLPSSDSQQPVGNASSVLINASQSQLLLSSNTTTASIRSLTQFIEIAGCGHRVELRAGNLSLLLFLNDDDADKEGVQQAKQVDRLITSADVSFASDEEDDAMLDAALDGKVAAMPPRPNANLNSQESSPIVDHATTEEYLRTSTPSSSISFSSDSSMVHNASFSTFGPNEKVPTDYPKPESTSASTLYSTAAAGGPVESGSSANSSSRSTSLLAQSTSDVNTGTSPAKLQRTSGDVTSSVDEFVFGHYAAEDSLIPILATIRAINSAGFQSRATTIVATKPATQHTAKMFDSSVNVNSTGSSSPLPKRGNRGLHMSHDGKGPQRPGALEHEEGVDASIEKPVFQLQLLVDKQLDIGSSEFKRVMETALSKALTNLTSTAQHQQKRKRSAKATMLPIQVRILNVSTESVGSDYALGEGSRGEIVSRITFTLNSPNESIPLRGEELNEELGLISPEDLNDRLPYQAVSGIVAVKHRSSHLRSIANSLSLAVPVGCVVIGGSLLIVFSLIVTRMAILDYIRQRRCIIGASRFHRKE